MESNRPFGRALLIPAVLLAACGLAPVDGDAGPGGEPDASMVVPERYRAEVAFASGTDLIPLEDPARCALRGPSRDGEAPDAVLADLTFSWTASGERRVYAGVFSERPRIEGTGADARVVPVESAVWAWATGGSRTDAGTVAWRQGFAPRADGLPDFESPPPTSLPRGVYWFVTWAWDDARALRFSSETRPFIWDPDAPGSLLAPGGFDGSAWCPEIEAEANPDTTARYWCVAPALGEGLGIQCLGWEPPDAPDAGTPSPDGGSSAPDGGA